MVKNTQNQAPERDIEVEKTVKEVNSILGRNDFGKIVDKLGIKKSLREVLKENKDNLELAKLAIRESYSNLLLIDSSLLKDPEIAKEVIKSGIRYGVSYFELDDFVNKHFKLDTKPFKMVYKYFNDKIKQASRLYNDDLLKTVQVLNEKKSDLLSKAKEKKLLSMGKNSRVSDRFIKFFEKNISTLGSSYLDSSEDEKRLFDLSILEKYLGIELKELDDGELFFIKTVLTLSLQSIDLKKIDKTIEDEKNKDDLEKDENEKISDDLDYDDEIDFDERLDFCSPGCSYTSISGGYEIDTGLSRKLKITEKENSNFTSISLRNYITFYNTLYDMGLKFLWDKYKSSFITLCNNKFGFDYIHGEGITESKLVSVLNLVGKNIGVPEKEISSPHPSPSKGEGVEQDRKIEKIGCFRNLADARLTFKEIKETGKINGDKLSDDSVFSSGAVEKYLELNGLSDKERGVLNISSWK